MIRVTQISGDVRIKNLSTNITRTASNNDVIASDEELLVAQGACAAIEYDGVEWFYYDGTNKELERDTIITPRILI